MPTRKSTDTQTDTDGPSPQPQTQTSPVQNVQATEQQLKARAEGDYLLPRSLTLRLAKAVLPPNTAIQKDAVLAIQKAATRERGDAQTDGYTRGRVFCAIRAGIGGVPA
ncbi:hypothetical protein CNMCM8060_005215 [Aspergillus lentulus]|nr:hypothetical protein CNMCM8060_005215 [Aspergillus lentulus]